MAANRLTTQPLFTAADMGSTINLSHNPYSEPNRELSSFISNVAHIRSLNLAGTGLRWAVYFQIILTLYCSSLYHIFSKTEYLGFDNLDMLKSLDVSVNPLEELCSGIDVGYINASATNLSEDGGMTYKCITDSLAITTLRNSQDLDIFIFSKHSSSPFVFILFFNNHLRPYACMYL